MSKIVVLAEAAEGHFSPLVPIVNRLILRGHQIAFITGRSFKERVEATGAAFHPLPLRWDPGEQEVYDFLPQLKQMHGLSQVKCYLKNILFDQVPDVLQTLRDVLASFSADVVICDTFMMAGIWITELGGPRSIRVSVLPLSLPGKDLAPFGLGWLTGSSPLSRLKNNLANICFHKVLFRDVQSHANTIRQELGLPRYRKSLFVEGFERPNLVMHLSTPSFEYPRKEFPSNFRFIGPVLLSPNDGYDPPAWWPELMDDRPAVLINQGTIARNHEELILPAIQSLRDEKITVIAVPVKEGEIEDLPENTHVEAYIPFGNLLPHIDVMITNGGFGGTQNALAHGIPLVIAGASEDKMEVAARVEYTGVGINLRTQKPSQEDIRSAVMKLLSDTSYKQRAKDLQDEFAKYDAPKLAVDFVEEIIETVNKRSNA